MTSILALSNVQMPGTCRRALAVLFLMGVAGLPVSQAAAMSPAVKMACLGDYLSYCRGHQVGSPQLRQCMRAAGAKLSKSCVRALVGAGEVSPIEVNRRAASLR